MAAHTARAIRASEGNDIDECFQSEACLETRGNSLSRRCLREAIDASGVIRKVLADEVDQTEQQFSKSLSGIKGGDFNQVLDNIRPSIRLDYAHRLADAERAGGLEELAAEALALAAIQYLRTRRIPMRPAKAGLK